MTIAEVDEWMQEVTPGWERLWGMSPVKASKGSCCWPQFHGEYFLLIFTGPSFIVNSKLKEYYFTVGVWPEDTLTTIDHKIAFSMALVPDFARHQSAGLLTMPEMACQEQTGILRTAL